MLSLIIFALVVITVQRLEHTLYLKPTQVVWRCFYIGSHTRHACNTVSLDLKLSNEGGMTIRVLKH